MESRGHSRITQRQIAELAGVSQATVSLVLNDRHASGVRIPDETRRRVLEIIRETTYVADPAARTLAGGRNSLVGVFTYEHAFPNETSDFYTPLLMGVETAAESFGVDLLMFTSAPTVDGRRRLFHENSRLRLADGCLLLGREMDAEELTRLNASGYPFVAIGRRDTADDETPYVGLDYATATTELARMALEKGHRRFAYVHLPLTAESSRDRLAGLTSALDAAGIQPSLVDADRDDPVSTWHRARETDPTVLFVEDPVDAAAVARAAAADGITIPRDLSVVVLGERNRPVGGSVDYTRLSAPRPALGSHAVALLDQLINGPRGDTVLPRRQLLDCTVIPGTTLTHPRGPAAG